MLPKKTWNIKTNNKIEFYIKKQTKSSNNGFYLKDLRPNEYQSTNNKKTGWKKLVQ